jgi:uncharacterized membrane protein YdjX (TVP38/TMEM64 family)
MTKWKKYLAFLPLLLIAGGMILLYFSHLKQEMSFQTIKDYHQTWKAHAEMHPFLSALLFMGILTVSVCLVIPNTILLGILAGFLFPLPLAILDISLSETLGAYLFYEAVGIAFVPPLHRNKKSFFWKLEKKIQSNEVSFLLFFRFTHLIPFFLINTAAACFEIKRRTFLWTTFVGILPLSYVLAQAGSGLGAFLENNESFSLSAIFNTKVEIALFALGVFALFPLLFKLSKHYNFWKKTQRK